MKKIKEIAWILYVLCFPVFILIDIERNSNNVFIGLFIVLFFMFAGIPIIESASKNLSQKNNS